MNSGPLTLGVEEEFQLLCPETLALVPHFDRLAACSQENNKIDPDDATYKGSDPKCESGLPNTIRIKRELHTCCSEVITQPCTSVSELAGALRGNRRQLLKIADRAGIAIGLSGTHPFAHWNDLPITRELRRLESEYLFQEAHRQCLVFALHIHVGIPNRVLGLQVMNDARGLLPILYALSCSSPFLEGRRTGLKSSRLLRAFGFPRTGIPDLLESVDQLEAQIASMQAAGLITDPGQLWWDIRLHHAYPTVEFRLADAVPRLDDVTALAALAQAFVANLLDAYQRGIRFLPIERWILCENRWRAGRFGTESELIDCALKMQNQSKQIQRLKQHQAPRRDLPPTNLELRPLRILVEELCDQLEPVAKRLGTSPYLQRCLDIATTGSSADRQLAIAKADASDLTRIVQQYRAETSDL